MKITKLIIIIMIFFPISETFPFEKHTKLISEQRLIDDGLYKPLPLYESAASTDWKNALRLTMKPAFGPAKIYELFLNRSYLTRNDKRERDSDIAEIRMVRTGQTEESVGKYLEYRKKKGEMLQEPLSKWDNSKERDRKKLDRILREADMICPPPAEITIEETSMIIHDPKLKYEIGDMEKRIRRFPDYVNPSRLRDGDTYIIEACKAGHYYYFLRLRSPEDILKELVDNFLNIINKIESEAGVNREGGH